MKFEVKTRINELRSFKFNEVCLLNNLWTTYIIMNFFHTTNNLHLFATASKLIVYDSVLSTTQ